MDPDKSELIRIDGQLSVQLNMPLVLFVQGMVDEELGTGNLQIERLDDLVDSELTRRFVACSRPVCNQQEGLEL